MPEVSVVIPCLNEEQCIEKCVVKAIHSFNKAGLNGEVIVVDNGSTDRSVEIAGKAGAVVISEQAKGYGSALRRGIEEAKGRFIVMADGDDTYDFLETAKFVELLRKGNDLVMGSRFKGQILPGAMTWSHRYVGNPILSGMLRVFFGGGVSDAHCGLRAFTKEAYRRMDLHTTGMEFASEMVIHALKKKLKIAEIPITYYPRQGESKLSSFRDAWRHIRFMLLYSPSYMFLWPGLILFTVCTATAIRLLFGPIYFLGRQWDIHVMVFCSMFALLGWQVLSLGLAAKAFAYAIGLEHEGKTRLILHHISLERSLLFGSLLFTAGAGMVIYILIIWAGNQFGELAQIKTGIFALALIVMGLQTIFTSFLVSMFQIRYKS